MITGGNTEKVLMVFIKEPARGFQYREITRLTKLGSSTVKRSLCLLEKNKFIKRVKGKVYDYYESNRDNRAFKILKICYTLTEIGKIIDTIIEKTRPNCVVLFGSASKGEDTEKSDIDIFVQAGRKELDFSKNERKLKRRINLIFEPKIEKINKELLNNLANGITIYGFLEVKT